MALSSMLIMDGNTCRYDKHYPKIDRPTQCVDLALNFPGFICRSSDYCAALRQLYPRITKMVTIQAYCARQVRNDCTQSRIEWTTSYS